METIKHCFYGNPNDVLSDEENTVRYTSLLDDYRDREHMISSSLDTIAEPNGNMEIIKRAFSSAKNKVMNINLTGSLNSIITRGQDIPTVANDVEVRDFPRTEIYSGENYDTYTPPSAQSMIAPEIKEETDIPPDIDHPLKMDSDKSDEEISD